MTISKQFTIVTPLSKTLALFLFILFPIAGFYLGVEYQRNLLLETQVSVPLSPQPQPRISSVVTEAHSVCQSNADCSSDQMCAVAGPIRIDGQNVKHCYGKTEAIPL